MNTKLKDSLEGFDNLSAFFSFLNKIPIVAYINYQLLKFGTEVSRLKPMKDIPIGKKVIDIGCGTCIVGEALNKSGHDVTCVDVVDLSAVKDIKPVIYDGENLPFADGTFDTSLLLFVLHHTPFPEQVIKEALRVSNSLVVLEDLYTGKIQSKWTDFLDSLINLEFKGHPHTNKTDQEWKDLFGKLGLKVEKARYWTIVPGWRHAAYFLTSNRV